MTEGYSFRISFYAGLYYASKFIAILITGTLGILLILYFGGQHTNFLPASELSLFGYIAHSVIPIWDPIAAFSALFSITFVTFFSFYYLRENTNIRRVFVASFVVGIFAAPLLAVISYFHYGDSFFDLSLGNQIILFLLSFMLLAFFAVGGSANYFNAKQKQSK